MNESCARETRSIWLWVIGTLIVFVPLLEGGTTHLAVMILRMLILALAAGYLWEGIRDGAFASPRLVIIWPVLAYLGVALISTATSSYSHQSRQWLLVLSSYAGLLVLLGCFVRRWHQVSTLMLVFIVTAAAEAGYGLLQASQGALRPSGTFFNPNFFAVYLAGAWIITFAYLCHALPSGTLRRPAPPGRPLTGDRATKALLLTWGPPVAVLVLLTPAILWTGSRGGLLALGLGAAVVTIIRFGRRAVVLLLVLLLSLFIVPNPVQNRLLIEHRANPETYARVQMWGQSLHAMREHPIGVGLGLYQYWAPQHMFPIEGQIVRYGKIATTAHNEYLQMGVELGVISLPIFAWGVWLVWREGTRALTSRLHRRQRGFVVGLLGTIACLLGHAAVDSTFHEPALAVLLTLCVALLLTSRRLAQRRPPPLHAVPLTSRALWATVGLIALVVLAAETTRLGVAWQAYESGTRAAEGYDLAKAVGRYRVAVTLDPGKALYHSGLASVYFQQFERTHEPSAVQVALQELQTASSLNSRDGRLLALLGHVCESVAASSPDGLSATKSRELWLTMAKVAYERAVELEPFSPFYRLNIGRLALALGEETVAESWVSGAVELEPNFLPAREWLTRRYLSSGRLDAAVQELQEIRERQRRYATWTKGSLEAGFLQIDTDALETALAEGEARVS